MEKETISIYTIAKEAGVSPATVSRVLTGVTIHPVVTISEEVII